MPRLETATQIQAPPGARRSTAWGDAGHGVMLGSDRPGGASMQIQITYCET
jgi:hypothetical protein